MGGFTTCESTTRLQAKRALLGPCMAEPEQQIVVTFVVGGLAAPTFHWPRVYHGASKRAGTVTVRKDFGAKTAVPVDLGLVLSMDSILPGCMGSRVAVRTDQHPTSQKSINPSPHVFPRF
ncbi:hypothetical protein J1614_008042 [Plenodomus biglobosus]|nr:hypothetical protein J1614_008042 [Plenodomus biglobosus]